MNTTIMLFVVAAVAVGVLFPQIFGSSNQTSPGEASRLAEEGAFIVDVRTPMEFAQGHIEGAVNIPLQDLSRRLDEFGAKDREIVLYCRSGNRSASAKATLTRAGYTSVHDAGAMSRLAREMR